MLAAHGADARWVASLHEQPSFALPGLRARDAAAPGARPLGARRGLVRLRPWGRLAGRSRCERRGRVVTDRSYTVLYRPQERGGRCLVACPGCCAGDGPWSRFPRFYAIIAVAGTAAGLLAHRTLGVRWWWGPVASVGAGWLWATSTAFFDAAPREAPPAP